MLIGRETVEPTIQVLHMTNVNLLSRYEWAAMIFMRGMPEPNTVSDLLRSHGDLGRLEENKASV